MIELHNVSFSYGNSPVLKDFNLKIDRGEHVVLMGESGCGKSTILNMIGKLISPSEGTVNVNTKKVAYMFQEPRLLPWLTVLENVNLVLGDRKETVPEAIKWLKQVGLSDSINKYPHELSGGMQQRVALARALAYNSEILLLDEPFSSLDEALACEMINLIKSHTANKTVLLVTHNSNHAKLFADTIYVIKKQKS